MWSFTVVNPLVRWFSVQASQKQKFATLEEDNLEHNPVLACMEKAHFLLKFAGLTRVQLKNEVFTGLVQTYFSLLPHNYHYFSCDTLYNLMFFSFTLAISWSVYLALSCLGEALAHSVSFFCLETVTQQNRKAVEEVWKQKIWQAECKGKLTSKG